MKARFTSFICWLVTALVMTACATRAAGDVIPLIQMDNVPLVDAIKNLARQAEINFIVDPRVPGFGPGMPPPESSVTARWTNVTAEAALSWLLKEHKLTMVSSPATTVTRIAPANLGVQPVSASEVGTNSGKVVPLIVMDFVPPTVAITRLGAEAGLKITFDSKASVRVFDRGSVSFRWQNITGRQALAALLDNYDLVMTEDAATSTARVGSKTMTPK